MVPTTVNGWRLKLLVVVVSLSHLERSAVMKFTQISSPKPKPFQCRLRSAEVEIQGNAYTVIPFDYGDLGRGFQVIKSGLNEQIYNVIHEDQSGINVCDCPDYQRRHQGNGYGMCKHGRGLVELGLLTRPLAP
jgi:hypothetical protein